MAETLFEAEPAIKRWAMISDDQQYRYCLHRWWEPDRSRLTFIMLNPSTADAEVDDPTIRRCLGFARTLGFDGIRVVNLYAYRATKPADLWRASEPTGGDRNDDLLREVLRQAKTWLTIAAWGANAKPERVAEVMSWRGAEHVHALGVTKDGAPRHPLRLRADAQPQPWPHPTCTRPRPHPTRGQRRAQPRPASAARRARNRGASMKKIPTLFRRDPEDMRRVLPEVTPGCEWVLNGEGVATRKYDGTCFLRDESGWWARREVKRGKTPPAEFRPVQRDDNTGKTVGWEPVESSPFVKFFREATYGKHGHELGTYELCGPKINGNPEGYPEHRLVPHAEAARVELPEGFPVAYDTLRPVLLAMGEQGIEGIVWHHPDGRMAKLKARDFPTSTAPSTAPGRDEEQQHG